MMLPFDLPSPSGSCSPPVWVGDGYIVDGHRVPVLEYSENFDGWSDDLTSLHENAVGASHPIDRASRLDAIRQLSKHLVDKRSTVLEIGCSSGFMVKAMKEVFPDALVIGADVVNDPLHRLAAELPSVPLMRFDLLRCPLPNGSVDAVVMLNVLEHIDSDKTALAQAHRILKPGGVLVVEVPAGPHLYDSYDRALQHFRRYGSEQLASMLIAAGFRVIRQSHLGFFVYPMFAYAKRRNQRTLPATSDDSTLVAQEASRTAASSLVKIAFRIEGFVGKFVRYPKGIRCLATCLK